MSSSSSSSSSRRRPASMTGIAVSVFLLLSCIINSASALHFYLEGSEQKCFLEELPKETTIIGTYKTEEWSEQFNKYQENPIGGLQINVDELHNKHRLLSQKGASAGKFTFTTQDAGEHLICLYSNSSTWFSAKRVKVSLDIQIGDPHNEQPANSDAKEALHDLAYKVRELNSKVMAIRREQQYQREREAEFRDTSESVNSRVIWWTIIQIIVLGVTGLWQMRHLKHFFQTKKLV